MAVIGFHLLIMGSLVNYVVFYVKINLNRGPEDPENSEEIFIVSEYDRISMAIVLLLMHKVLF